MKILLFLCLFESIKHLRACEPACLHRNDPEHVDIYEFGVNSGAVVFSVLGEISSKEKLIRVPIKIPYCHKMVYVHVETRNKRSPPYVDVEWEWNTVVIKYRQDQYSESCYTIVAKSLKSPYCSRVSAGRVVLNVEGEMGKYDKTARVPVNISRCQKMVFVHVETRNEVGPPYVSVDWDINMVEIKYRTDQWSKSCYTIVAKSLKIPNCRF